MSFVQDCNRALADSIKEATKIIASNTPLSDSDKLPYGPIADELDKAREHLSSALRMVKRLEEPK